MSQLVVRGISTDQVTRWRAGGVDAHGRPPIVHKAAGPVDPCRHCLGLIEIGDDELLLAYRPFEDPQPYAEVGPIFLHAGACRRYESVSLPGWFDFMDTALVRGYGFNHWIRYETGEALAGRELTRACERILADDTIAYVHVRSKFGCFQCRVDRG